MADERQRGPLSGHGADDPATTLEQQLLAIADQELAHLSTVEPRTGFESRLRAAVHESMVAPARWPIWLWPSVTAAAAVALTFVLFFVVRPAREVAAVVDDPAVSLLAPAPTPARAPVTEPALAASQPPESRVLASPPRRNTAHRNVQPEVLIPPGEAQALVEWVAQVNREQRVPALLVSADTPAGQDGTFTNIEIQPIEIVPLEPAMSSGT